MHGLRYGRLLFLVLAMTPAAATVDAGAVDWGRDETLAFAKAKQDRRFVLLYLEAVWCHWCHVMDRKTYGDAGVGALIKKHYVPLRIDQDSRPDLAARYRDYGWPATIVFSADGSEIVKRQGFIDPDSMRRLLAAIVEDPSPESLPPPQVAPATSTLATAVREALQARHRSSVDATRGGLRMAQKYLDRDTVEYALWLGGEGDHEELARARITLDAAFALFDPIWGGVYQYSTGGDWTHPHFEKLASLQAEYLRIYALAYAQTGETRYGENVGSIRRYLDAFLSSPDGGWFASQDADLVPGRHSAEYYALDDQGRRAQGVPRIDRNRYAKETGLLIEALALWSEISGDLRAGEEAVAAASWALFALHRKQGGFRHSTDGEDGSYLADNLGMGRALLQLYRLTANRKWLREAELAAAAIAALKAGSGFLSAALGGPIAPIAQIDENIAAARFFNALARYTGNTAHRAFAEHALGFLARPDVALSRLTEAGILLADAEFGRDPLHLTVLGAKQDTAALALFEAALRIPAAYKRLEWWDAAEGPLPNPDVTYPPQKRAAAFVCTDRRCSLPIRNPEDLAAFVADLKSTQP